MADATASVAELRQALPCLRPGEFDVFLRGVLKLRLGDADRLGLFDQLRAGFWEWLAHVEFVTDAQRRYALDCVTPALADYARALEGAGDPAAVPGMLVTVGDERYLTWSGNGGPWRDILYQEEVGETERPVATYLVCDVFGVYHRLRGNVLRVRSRKDAVHDRHDGGAEGSDGGRP